MWRPLCYLAFLLTNWLQLGVVHAQSIDQTQLQALTQQAQTDPKAAKQLAYRYIKGNGLKKDVAKGLRLLERAAELGDREALDFLANAYTNKKSPLYQPEKYVVLLGKIEDLTSKKIFWSESRELQEAVNRSQSKLIGTGSAFAISKTGIFTTNHHVVDGCAILVIVYNDQFAISEVLSQDKKRDLALLKVEEQTPDFLQIRTTKVSLGESVSIGGFPYSVSESGDSFAFNVGVVGTFPTIDGVSHIQVSAPIASGNSGGAAIDDTGAVLGVAVGKIPGGLKASGAVMGDNYNFVISNMELLNFLEKRNVIFAESSSSKKLNPKQSAQKLERASAQVLCFKK